MSPLAGLPDSELGLEAWILVEPVRAHQMRTLNTPASAAAGKSFDRIHGADAAERCRRPNEILRTPEQPGAVKEHGRGLAPLVRRQVSPGHPMQQPLPGRGIRSPAAVLPQL